MGKAEMENPTQRVTTKDGRPLLLLREKIDKRTGNVFYLYQVFEENIENQEDKRKVVMTMDWLRDKALSQRTPLICIDDILEALEGKKEAGIHDMTIVLKDRASGRMITSVVGPPGPLQT